MSPPSPNARSSTGREALEALIKRVIKDLLKMPVTPHARELRAKAVTYGRVINNWSTYTPTEAQVLAMQECVVELEVKVEEALRRDVSQVSRRPDAPSRAPSPTLGGMQPSSLSSRPVPRGTTEDDEFGSVGPWGSLHPSSPTPKGQAAVMPSKTPPTLDTPTPALLQSRRPRW